MVLWLTLGFWVKAKINTYKNNHDPWKTFINTVLLLLLLLCELLHNLDLEKKDWVYEYVISKKLPRNFFFLMPRNRRIIIIYTYLFSRCYEILDSLCYLPLDVIQTIQLWIIAPFGIFFFVHAPLSTILVTNTAWTSKFILPDSPSFSWGGADKGRSSISTTVNNPLSVYSRWLSCSFKWSNLLKIY